MSPRCRTCGAPGEPGECRYCQSTILPPGVELEPTWIEVTTLGDGEPRFVRGPDRAVPRFPNDPPVSQR